MKTGLGFVIFSIVLASCMSYSCPTYDGVKGRSASIAATKKSRPAKDRTPYYKLTKQAEKD